MIAYPTGFDKRSNSVDAIWQLLYPDGPGTYGVIDLTSMIIAEQGRGTPPLHYNTHRGVYQHGETPLNLRLDPRIIQVAISSDHDNRSQMYDNLMRLLNRVNPGRNWSPSGTLTKCIYRKIMPGGRKQWRSDLVTVGGSEVVTSATARFVEWGLGAGDAFYILSGDNSDEYVIESVTNENTLSLTQAMAWTANNVEYRVYTGRIVRELDVLLESGPMLEDNRQEDTLAVTDVIRLVAHDPVWRNPIRQSITWSVEDLANLIFYAAPDWTNKAAFPIWFGTDYVSDTSNLTYVGTWPARPMIIADGPFSELTLENTSTGDTINMYYAAAAGERVTIDLDAMTVTNNLGANLMRYMSTPYADVDSDLITFGLYPHPHVTGGINAMKIGMSDAVQGSTQALLYWYSRYIGA